MVAQYLRKVSLVAGDGGGTGLDLSEMRIRFRVNRVIEQLLTTLSATVYNLSENTANQIQNEYTRVVLKAGYPGNYGIIFRGTIAQARRGRSSATDTFLEIRAMDGDVAYHNAVVNTTLGAGTGPHDVLNAAVMAMEPHGVTLGYTGEFTQQGYPRGRVMYGMARDYLSDLARNNLMAWSIQDEQVQMVPVSAYLPGEAVVMNANTGLIGIPELTQDGISFRCLLNPAIKVGRLVQLDNRSINPASYTLGVQGVAALNPYTSNPAALSKFGLYKVLVVEHEGDTRGNEYYSEVICMAVDGAAPLSRSVLNANVEPI